MARPKEDCHCKHCYMNSFQKEGAHHTTERHIGKQQGLSGGRGEEKMWARDFIVVPQEGVYRISRGKTG